MNPQTNNQPAGSQSQFFGQKVSIPGINVNSAGDNQLIMQDNYSTRIYYNSDGIATVLLGTRVANSNNDIGQNQQGFYVSQSGIDVRNATDLQLIFNSQQNVLKINKQGIASTALGVPVSTYSTTLTIAHNLGYIPAAMVYVSINQSLTSDSYPLYVQGTYAALPITFFIYTGSTYVPLLGASFSTDKNNLYIQTALIENFNSGLTYTFTFQYYILADSITP